MRNRQIAIWILLILIHNSCVPFKDELESTGSKKNAVQNAILDFSKTSKLYKKNSIFEVSYEDTLYTMVLRPKKGEDYYEYVRDELYKNIVVVNILPNPDKIRIKGKAQDKIGNKGILPSRYIEKDGKLFYWYDDNYPFTKKVLSVFKKYNLIEENLNRWEVFDVEINDAQKGVDYYFCRDNLLKYKKKTTSVALGYYPPPRLNCN